ncbi:hypothetical protein BDN72DRAFT_837476 [Pluteus cervinus]|uniref:Uncharacterized protein n=1 Tax=Pluteus cervinus TaxID=181527 RepID=A0ACD3B0F7_9AGAR|nr:hypothetical protein BDN72DRAFT_837476 [Pluteus cervinus]
MSTGFALFQHAEILYSQGKVDETFEAYQRCIKKVLKNELLTAKLPHAVPNQVPQEFLGYAWMNFAGFFLDPNFNYTQDTAPEAYKLLHSFCTSSGRDHSRFRGTQGQILLKAMQIVAGLTLGLLAWDKSDRATAAKRYQEALDIAATHPPFNQILPASKHLDLFVATQVQQVKDNLEILTQKDDDNAQLLRAVGFGGGQLRKEVLNLPQMRRTATGEFVVEKTITSATDACAHCGSRAAKLRRCTCRRVAYCNTECQKLNWKTHKMACQAGR